MAQTFHTGKCKTIANYLRQLLPCYNGKMDKISCVIYKGIKKPESYLFVEKADDFSRVPETLLRLLGKLEMVMQLDLSPDMQLAQADINSVIRQLTDQGFFLQLPSDYDKSKLQH